MPTLGVEKLVKRHLHRMVFWRIVSDIIAIPRRILQGVLDAWLALETAVFCLELDAARQYEQLTEIDMGRACGQDGRYEGLHPEVVFSLEDED